MVPMNHCFQSLTGSFFPALSPFLFLSPFLSLSVPLLFPLCASLSFFLFSTQSCPLSARLTLTSPGTRIEGRCFMIVNIFHGIVLGVVLQPILSPGEQGLGIFSPTQSRYVDFFFSVMEVGQVLFRMCVCMHE